MYILHIETSTNICSVALSNSDILMQHIDLREGMNHTALLAPAIKDLLESCDVGCSELAAISVSAGPGSFTGLRVGSSTAKGMAYSLGLPVVPVPTLWALAEAAFKKHPEAKRAMPMIDARRMEVYTAIYHRFEGPIQPVSSFILDEMNLQSISHEGDEIVMCGNGSMKLGGFVLPPNFKTDTSLQCSAVHLVGPAFQLYQKGDFEDSLHFIPFYLKPPNITKPRVME